MIPVGESGGLDDDEMTNRSDALPSTATRAVLVAALCCACSSSAAPVEVPDFDLPTITDLSGPVLKAPRVQPIYFPGFPYASDMDTFFQRLAASTYWPAVVTEYGVGALTALPGYATNVALPATLSDVDLSTFLVQALTEGYATLGAPREDTIYALFLSPDSTLTMQGQTFCGDGDPSANHEEVAFADNHLVDAFFPTCPTSSASSTLTGVDALTPTVSREIVETATDPFVYSNPAFGMIDGLHALWAGAIHEEEVGDLCENERPNLITPPDIGHPVQRIWSNRSAQAGTGPCVPVPPGEVYFNAVAAMPTLVDYDPFGETYPLPAMDAEVGLPVSAQISFRGGPTAPSPLTAVAFELDDAGSLSVEQPAEVMGAPDQAVAAPVATSAPMASGLLPLVIRATDAAHSAVHYWVGAINRH
jgi:hypothetical protein